MNRIYCLGEAGWQRNTTSQNIGNTTYTHTLEWKKTTYFIFKKTLYGWDLRIFSAFLRRARKKKKTNLSKGIQGAHGYFSLYFSIKFKICLFVIVSHISCLSLFLSLVAVERFSHLILCIWGAIFFCVEFPYTPNPNW